MKKQECLCSIQCLLPIPLSRECTVVGNTWQLGVDFKTLLVGDIIGLGGDDIIGLVGIVRALDTDAMEEIRENQF